MSQSHLKNVREQNTKRMYNLYMQTPYKLMDTNAMKRKQRQEQRQWKESTSPYFFINSPSHQTLDSVAKSRAKSNKRQTDTSNEDKKARQRESIGTQKSLLQTLDSLSTKKNLNKSKTARGDDFKEVEQPKAKELRNA